MTTNPNPNPNSTVLKLDNIFSPQELQELNDLFDLNAAIQENSEYFPQLGRLNVLLYGSPAFPQHLVDKLTAAVSSQLGHLDLELVLAPGAAEYSSKYGQPELLPHYDGDWTDLIVDFQLSSNTVWPIGVELSTYTLEDNSGLIFNPNGSLHWRPRKNFKDGEYVRMIFFRFHNSTNPTNNEGREKAGPDDQHHKDVLTYLESLGTL